MPSSTSRKVVAFLVFLALLPGGVRSAEDQKAKDDTKQPQQVELWLHDLDTADEHLRAGDFTKALQMALRLERQMLDTIQGGPGAGPLLARTLVARSFAEVGLGQIEDGVWDWFTARAVHPELTDESLTRAGKVGDKLLEVIKAFPPNPI
ncbi:MAG TPA: hypothetical protein VEW48_23485 [Thermoanaerobaculia bacterium]|nr:hypothetical protein [Thermoanaerobaculia bacterium]